MGKHPTDQSEEIFEATKERSHCVIGGIEVVEYDQADSDQAELASAATGSDGTPEIETAHDDAAQEHLRRELSRLNERLAHTREQLESQRKDHLCRTSKLVLQINTLQAELRDKETRIGLLSATCDGLRQQLDQGADREFGVLSGSIEQHHSETDVVSSLKERLKERGQALKLAHQEVSALHKERDEMSAALAERTRQVAQLLEQVAQAEIQNGFGMDFRSSLKRLFQRYPKLATGSGEVDAWEEHHGGVATIALDSPPADVEPHGSAGTSTHGAGGDLATSSGVDAGTRGSETRLQRFLLPLREGTASVLELTSARAYVGRGIAADVRIRHPSVSRLHGVLFCIGGATIVEDARSTNGVYVNGRRIDQFVLKDGDVLAFGSVEFRFRVAVSED